MKRNILMILLVVLLAGCGTSASQKSSDDSMGMKIVAMDVEYLEGNSQVKGYLARPDDNKQHPGLILIHEWWGLNENIKENARRYAKLGYVALAVDLYDGNAATTPQEARKLAVSVSKNMPAAFKNLENAVTYLKNQKNWVQADTLASIGWCFGGGWSYQMAKNNLGVKASVIYYDRFNPKDDLQQMRATIIGHFGENDRGIKVDNVKEFQATLKTHNGNHEVYIYPNAGHAFANDGGANYNKEAADLAWERTNDFLKRYL